MAEVSLLGLTGPPGAGKTSVLRWLHGAGAQTLDADDAVRAVLDEEAAIIQAIANRFGPAAITGDKVDRQALAGVVFADTAALRDLEAIVHPTVTDRIMEWKKGLTSPTAALEAIKLVQSDLARLCAEIWLVVADRRTRSARLLERGWPQDEIERRSSAAPPLGAALAVAREVIDNSGPWSHTELQLEAAWTRFTGGDR